MYTTAGHCPKCGAPIYAPMNWMSIMPPPSIHTCGCAGQDINIKAKITTDTRVSNNATNNIPICNVYTSNTSTNSI